MTQLRRLRADETEPLRELRLRALREDPGAFAETYEEATARPRDDWASWAADESRVIVVAIDGGRGLGLDWARERGAVAVELSVTTNNPAAAAFYTRAGFAETGRRRPLPADPSRTEVFLRRPISPARPQGR